MQLPHVPCQERFVERGDPRPGDMHRSAVDLPAQQHVHRELFRGPDGPNPVGERRGWPFFRDAERRQQPILAVHPGQGLVLQHPAHPPLGGLDEHLKVLDDRKVGRGEDEPGFDDLVHSWVEPGGLQVGEQQVGRQRHRASSGCGQAAVQRRRVSVPGRSAGAAGVAGSGRCPGKVISGN